MRQKRTQKMLVFLILVDAKCCPSVNILWNLYCGIFRKKAISAKPKLRAILYFFKYYYINIIILIYPFQNCIPYTCYNQNLSNFKIPHTIWIILYSEDQRCTNLFQYLCCYLLCSCPHIDTTNLKQMIFFYMYFFHIFHHVPSIHGNTVMGKTVYPLSFEQGYNDG